MLKGSSWKAILGGVAIEVAGPRLFNSILGFIALLILLGPGLLRGDLPEDLGDFKDSIPRLPLLMVGGLSIVGEIVLNGIGGYATATWAPKHKIAHSLIVGLLSLAVGLLLPVLLGRESSSSWYSFNQPCIVPASLLGGWWSVKKHGAESRSKPAKQKGANSPPIAPPS